MTASLENLIHAPSLSDLDPILGLTEALSLISNRFNGLAQATL